MMAAAQRHGELIAHLAAECAVLREAQMMGIEGLTAANQAWLLGHELDVVLVANAARLRIARARSCRCLGTVTPTRLCCARILPQARLSLIQRPITGRRSPVQPRFRSAASLAWNASSICCASAAVKLFLAPRSGAPRL